MGKNIMDTQDLSEIRRLIGDVPAAPRTGDFDVDSIIAEVEGKKKAPATSEPEQEETPPEPLPAAGQFTQRITPIKVAQKKRKEAPPAPEVPPTPQAPQETAEPQVEEIIKKRRSQFRVIEAPLDGSSAKPEPEEPLQMTQRIISVGQAQPEPEPPPLHAVPEEEELDRREQKKRKKAEKKAAKAARREAERQAEEEEEAYEARDPRVAQNSCARRARGLTGRSLFVLVMFLGTAYLTLAGGMGWPLPQVLNYAENTIMCVLAMLIMQFLAMLIGVDIIGGGLYALFSGSPDRKMLVSLACLSTLLHGITIIIQPKWGGLLPCCAVSLLLLFACMQEERARYAGRRRAFKVANMATHPTGVYYHRDDKNDVRAAVKTRMQSVRPFLVEMEKPDTAQRFSALYAPIMVAASVIFALLVSVVHGEPWRFFWALSVMLVMSAPLGVLCASGPAYSGASRRLLAEGAAISGARSACILRRSKQAILTDGDLFPAGSITIDGVRNYGSYSAEKLLAYAAAVTSGQGLEIGRVFLESLREQYGRPVRATNVLQYESGGLSADIGGDSVLVGTAAFLMKLHVRIRDMHGVENGVFVVINNQVAGVFLLTYHPSAPTYSALQAFRRLRVKPVLATRDFNISPAMVESLFELRSGATESASAAESMSGESYTQRDMVCGILSHDGVTPFTQLLHSAEKLGEAVKTNLALGTFSGICGLLLSFYLANLRAVDQLQPKNLLIYLILWYIPSFLITLGTRRKY